MRGRQPMFIARTVFVNDNNVEAAMRVVNRILGQEGLLATYRRTRRYEKPYMVRRRLNFERCKALINEDLGRKTNLILRQNRIDPYPGCS